MTGFVKGAVPLYAQLEAALRESIRQGTWGPYEPLPSDRELAEQWRVSRCTVRQALDNLVRDGLIERRQGKGTFVVPPEVLRDFIGYYTFGGSEEEPIHLTSKVISFEPVVPPQKVAELLRVMPGIQVPWIRLVRFANERPVLLLISYMSPKECSGLTAEDLTALPVLTEAITHRCRIPLVSQRRSVQATHITGEDAELLQVQPGSLGLLMERVTYTEFRQPIEYGYTLVPGDSCTYTIDISRSGGRIVRAPRDPFAR